MEEELDEFIAKANRLTPSRGGGGESRSRRRTDRRDSSDSHSRHRSDSHSRHRKRRS